MLGSRCECGEERIKQGREGFQPGNGLSFLAFDFIRELLVIKAHLVMPEESLPPALRPLDAELAFDDIVSQGLHIVHKEIVPQPGRHRVLERHYEVTVTVTCRRPPRFFTAFEQNDALEDMRDGRKMPYRRRATAMDFAITGVVRHNDQCLLTIADREGCGTD